MTRRAPTPPASAPPVPTPPTPPTATSPTAHDAAEPDALAGPGPLIDPHAHFHPPHGGRRDWAQYNASRLEAGRRMGVRWHVVSVLGSWGHTSPTYFASPTDQTAANGWLYEAVRAEPQRVRAWVAVNPNHTRHALDEIAAGAAAGAVGIKLAAGRRADDALLDDIAAAAAQRGWPVLQHVWQHRRRDWPMQDASDGVELGRLAARHPGVTFLLAHLGGGGDWAHTLPAVRDIPNIVADLSGSGIDRGMLDAAIEVLGPRRLLWAADLTLCTGLTKARALDVIGLPAGDRADIRWRNAVRLFPAGTFPDLEPLMDDPLAAAPTASRPAAPDAHEPRGHHAAGAADAH